MSLPLQKWERKKNPTGHQRSKPAKKKRKSAVEILSSDSEESITSQVDIITTPKLVAVTTPDQNSSPEVVISTLEHQIGSQFSSAIRNPEKNIPVRQLFTDTQLAHCSKSQLTSVESLPTNDSSIIIGN
ncbi:unnamed protein product [Allacma fusca]|uniref:Uncharacterized protein n=1 Tax=Allacma fusca TaxID=39272 RepID=A0A8J2KKP0_9HEXA|nr:unnamed protein product [Allacma fusca]